MRFFYQSFGIFTLSQSHNPNFYFLGIFRPNFMLICLTSGFDFLSWFITYYIVQEEYRKISSVSILVCKTHNHRLNFSLKPIFFKTLVIIVLIRVDGILPPSLSYQNPLATGLFSHYYWKKDFGFLYITNFVLIIFLSKMYN